MPLYRITCKAQHLNEVLTSSDKIDGKRCPTCHRRTRIEWSKSAKPIFFRAGVYEHISFDAGKKHIDSMAMLVAECRKHNVTSHYAEDMASLWRTKSNRWV